MKTTYFYEALDSTNIVAKKLAEQGAKHGTGVVAKVQTAGRGRLGKKWFSSPGGGLYCSIVVKPEIHPPDYHKITVAAGLGVAEVLERLLNKTAGLKWPNDVKFNGRKCAGILTESSPVGPDGAFKYAVIGIGVNVNIELFQFPEELQKSVTSLFIEAAEKFSIDEVFALIRENIISVLSVCEERGFKDIFARWRSRDILVGKVMDCVAANGRVVRGISLGMDDDGVLHVKTPDGILHEVLSGDVSLAVDNEQE